MAFENRPGGKKYRAQLDRIERKVSIVTVLVVVLVVVVILIVAKRL